ncbi:hypothetical protein Tco_0546191 [Tanacetum coccineum]
MSMSVQKSQVHKMAKRLCLVDDLKMLKITMSNTSSRNKLNPEVNDHYNIFSRESQEYELKTKDEAYWRDDGYCNGGNLPGAYIVGNTLHYQDIEWYEALNDCKLKEEALKNKAIMEGLIEDESDESIEERCDLFDDQERPVCNIRRFEMIKYSFGQDEEYGAVKENEEKDLKNISEDTCRAYQEIFRMMDEGWMLTRAE